MKELSLDDRPREKLLRHGASSLGDNELVALVIGQGTWQIRDPEEFSRTRIALLKGES